MNSKLAEIAHLLNMNNKWLILGHEKPDGDTLGCALALYSTGKKLGKNVRVGGKDPLPEKYHFLPNYEVFEVIPTLDFDVSDTVVISVDTSTRERSVGNIDAVLNAKSSINIDHHFDNQKYCEINYVDSNASATAEIITDLIYENWRLEKDEAICLYAALTTDNGNFRFPSTTPKSHECAAKLLFAGVNPAYMDDCINENMTADILRLWGIALTKTEVFANGEAAIFSLNGEDFKCCNADQSDVESLVNMLLRIKGTKVVAFVTEIDNECKASIRTRAPYNAREIAAYFGGGGHDRASGAKLSGSFEDAVSNMKVEMEKYVKNGLFNN